MRVAVPTNEDVPLSLIGHHYAPEIASAAIDFSVATNARARLSLREFEAARIVTAYINGCMVCQTWRTGRDLPAFFDALGAESGATILGAGAEPDEAFYVAAKDWRTSPLFSERERLAAEMAERMGVEPKALATDEDFWARAKCCFKDPELIDLAYCIACWMGLGRMTHVLGLDAACELPVIPGQASSRGAPAKASA